MPANRSAVPNPDVKGNRIGTEPRVHIPSRSPDQDRSRSTRLYDVLAVRQSLLVVEIYRRVVRTGTGAVHVVKCA